VRVGVSIADFSGTSGPRLGSDLAAVGRALDDAGFDLIGVMDHFFQIAGIGPPEADMLEAYTTLGYLAASTSRARLLTVVTGVSYRHPGVLAKIVTTLDVLSGGRAWLGIGAAWYEQEARALGIPFPPLAERFEQLEEALQICLQMWSGDEAPYHGEYFDLSRPLNHPQAITRPHPPIMIGGTGERKTLRLVARYAQACNLFFPGPQLPHKLEVLRAHCEAEGRDYNEIEKSVLFHLDVGERGERARQVVDELGTLAELGISTAICNVARIWDRKPIEIIGGEIIPVVATL
jgi:F420-dependent oxidoreductase-like protein